MPPTRPAAGPLAALFDPATYAGARVSADDGHDTLVASGVRGDLTVTFTRRLSGWQVLVDVAVAVGDAAPVRVAQNADPDARLMGLWESLCRMSRDAYSADRDAGLARVVEALNRRP